MASPPPPITSKFNLMQRTVQAVFGTREFAVVSMVVFCVAVELGILVATQRYEANIAPPGTALLWGMSAVGTVVFFVELLKLPVAWMSGLVSGKRMIVLNIVTGSLCLLTTITIEDLVKWEWQQALKPARDVREEAHNVANEIKALEDRKRSLTEDPEQATKRRQALVAQNTELLNDQYERRDADMVFFQESLGNLRKQNLSREKQTEFENLQTQRTSAESRFKQDIDGLEAHLKTLNDQRSNVQKPGSDSGNSAADRRDRRRQEYETARQIVEDECADKIAQLGPDGPFKDIPGKTAQLKAERDKELSRLKDEYDRDIESYNANDPNGLTDLNREIEDVRKQIAEKQKQRDDDLKGIDTKINELRAKGGRINADAQLAYDREVARIEAERDKRMAALQFQIDGYEARLLDLQTDSKQQRTPQQDAVEIAEISGQLPTLQAKRARLEAESTRLENESTPMRTANGILRWIMPDASTERLLQVAFGVFPLGMALLVSFMPAGLLEISVYCVRPEIRRTERPRQNPFARLGRVRRTLSQLRTRAQERLTKADAALRECQLVRDNLALEHVNRTANLDREVEQKIELAMTDLHAKTDQLENELAQARSREAELGSKLSEVTSLAARAAEDVHKLTSHVVRLDAKVSQQR